MIFVRILVALVAAFGAAGTLLPLIRRDAWWIRVFDFPRLQVAALSALAAAAFPWAFGRSPWALGAWGGALGSLGFQLRKIFPYTPLASREVKPVEEGAGPELESLSLLVANVLISNREADTLLHLVEEHQPDLVLAVETDDWWADALSALDERYPHTVKHPLDNTYGMLLFSRLELVDAEVKFLIRDDIPSIHTRVQLTNGQEVELRCVHPQPPYPEWAKTTTNRDAELLLVGQEVRDLDRPVIVAGDLNDVAWSYTTSLFQKTSRLLDPRIGRGMFSTFHADYPLLRWPLDHVFISDHFELKRLERLPAWGSDHFPIFIEVGLVAGAEHEQEAPNPDAEEEAFAEEKIEKAMG